MNSYDVSYYRHGIPNIVRRQIKLRDLMGFVKTYKFDHIWLSAHDMEQLSLAESLFLIAGHVSYGMNYIDSKWYLTIELTQNNKRR